MIQILKSGEFKASRKIDAAGTSAIAASVAGIIADVRNRGDAALREYTERFDSCSPDTFELPMSALDAAVSKAGPEIVGVMERAAKNIEDYHRRQMHQGYIMTDKDGIALGQRVLPIERVGLYIPGGTAAYPSSVLMNCIPAKLAGVGEISIATPPGNCGDPGFHGIDPGLLAAAKIAGAHRVFTIGGAQAIAALAFGTQTIPRVDKITGPGNAYVAEAKRQVFGIVGIDMIAGPSDVLIIADGCANAELVAADMLSQCEHGEDSIAVLVTTSAELAGKVSAEIETQLLSLPRERIARKSIDENGTIIIASTIEQAFEISNEIAPEHLEIFLDDPLLYLDLVKNAGSIFLGKNAPVALGDYYAGPNHTLPTSGTSRFSSPVSVDDFVKKSSFTYYTENALREAGADIALFAEKEGLAAHSLSVRKRMDAK